METLLVIWMYLLNTGTNLAFIKFIMGNALLLGFIAFVTPWTWDNKVIEWLKSNIMKKGK